MLRKRYDLAIAGLLHDIGKFWQRAESSHQQVLGPGYEDFGEEDYGKNGAHATWSTAYISKYLPRDLDIDYSTVLYHHKPDTNHADAQRLALADRLASGERSQVPTSQTPQLLTIFSQLNGGTAKAYFPLKEMALRKATLFPLTDPLDESARRTAYQDLWSRFAEASEFVSTVRDPKTLLTTVFHLMEQFTWCVPAAFYRSVPDISLFDHSRVTASVAACLADLPDDLVASYLSQLNQGKPDQESPIAYLLEGDISGVQQFIYTITARGAAPALRGRSFYLQLLTDAIANYILRWLELPITNLIYSGGGHFYMLIPASEFNQLDRIQQQLDRIMLAHHYGNLYVALGAAPLTCADFEIDHFHRIWRRVSQQVSQAKRGRFSRLSPEALTDFLFAPSGMGGDETQECQVTHYEGPDVQLTQRYEDDPNPVRKSRMVITLEELGRELRNASRLLLLDIDPTSYYELEYTDRQGTGRDWQSVLADLGVVAIVDPESRPGLSMELSIYQGTLLGFDQLPSIIETRQLEDALTVPVARGVQFLANVAPQRRDGNYADFSDLQEAAADPRGIKRLGVLRMDVDDLGNVFAHGFETVDANHSTLARVASLSSALSRYFEGWIGELCHQLNNERQRAGKDEVVYSIYSGGDDLFIVGAWNYLVELAHTIRQDFQHYSLGTVDLSGAVTLHGGKEPLYQAARAAHDALDSAKSLPGKAAFTLFGRSNKWSDFKAVVDWRDWLLDLIAEEEVQRGLLRQLIELYLQQEEQATQYRKQGYGVTLDGREQTIYGPFMWRGIYQLTRLADRARDKSISADITELKNRLQAQEFRGFQLIGLAARWAEALTRKESEGEE